MGWVKPLMEERRIDGDTMVVRTFTGSVKERKQG